MWGLTALAAKPFVWLLPLFFFSSTGCSSQITQWGGNEGRDLWTAERLTVSCSRCHKCTGMKEFSLLFFLFIKFFSLCPLSFFIITDDFFVVFDYELTTFQRQTLALSFSLLVTFSVSKELCFPFRWIQLSAGLWIDFTMRKTPVSNMTSAANCGFTCTAIAARKSLVSHKAYFKIFLVYGAALKNSVLFLLNIRIQYSALYEGHYQKTLGAY